MMCICVFFSYVIAYLQKGSRARQYTDFVEGLLVVSSASLLESSYLLDPVLISW